MAQGRVGARRVTSIGMLLALLFGIALCASQLAWANESGETGDTDAKALSSTALKAESFRDATDENGLNSQAATAPSIVYRTKSIGKKWQAAKRNGATSGTTKRSRSIEAVLIKTTGTPEGSVQYQVHIAGDRWMPAQSDNAIAAASSKNNAIDAVRIALTGELSKTYSVAYRVNLRSSGWQSWKTDGLVSGAVNNGSSVRALQVKLVKKETASKLGGKGIIGVHYRVKSEESGWGKWAINNSLAGTTGKSRSALNFQITLDSGAYKGSIAYRTHTVSGAWSGWKRNGETIKEKGKIDAIQLKLTGEIAKKYAVEYRAHVQNIGWQRQMHDGETAGTEGMGLQVEALRVKLVSRNRLSGWIKNADSSWSYYRSGKKISSEWIVTETHPIETTMTSGLQRYWIGADGLLAVNRYVNPKTEVDAKAGWTAFATRSGYVALGKYTNADGLLLAGDAGELSTSSGWLVTDKYDGEIRKYRLAKKGVCAVVRTGLFKVAGKKYYAWPDDRGYLMTSSAKCIGSTWYEADAKGVLNNINDRLNEIIDRYVNWAINIANDDSHGYSQYDRWGPDYDCSSLVCASLLATGFPDSGASWTGNMKLCLEKIGFNWHPDTDDLQRGDIMLIHTDNRQHTEIYIGDGQLVGAHIAETGTIYGEPGDQTGNEISVTGYYNIPWEGYLRYRG